jgi:hypothetical protein
MIRSVGNIDYSEKMKPRGRRAPLLLLLCLTCVCALVVYPMLLFVSVFDPNNAGRMSTVFDPERLRFTLCVQVNASQFR